MYNNLANAITIQKNRRIKLKTMFLLVYRKFFKDLNKIFNW